MGWVRWVSRVRLLFYLVRCWCSFILVWYLGLVRGVLDVDSRAVQYFEGPTALASERNNNRCLCFLWPFLAVFLSPLSLSFPWRACHFFHGGRVKKRASLLSWRRAVLMREVLLAVVGLPVPCSSFPCNFNFDFNLKGQAH